MIVDFEGIMREASAMQDMTKQIKTRQEAYQQEIEKRQQGLRKEEQGNRPAANPSVCRCHSAETERISAESCRFSKVCTGAQPYSGSGA